MLLIRFLVAAYLAAGAVLSLPVERSNGLQSGLTVKQAEPQLEPRGTESRLIIAKRDSLDARSWYSSSLPWLDDLTHSFRANLPGWRTMTPVKGREGWVKIAGREIQLDQLRHATTQLSNLRKHRVYYDPIPGSTDASRMYRIKVPRGHQFPRAPPIPQTTRANPFSGFSSWFR